MKHSVTCVAALTLVVGSASADPFSQGHICPKAVALQDIYHDPDRLRRPVRRRCRRPS